jgi:ribokinase
MAYITVIGSLNMDLVLHVHELPKEGETVLGAKMLEGAGGKGGSQAAAIGKLEVPVCMIGKLGLDHYGEHLLESLNHAGVSTEHILRSSSRTGVALVTVDKSGKNHIVVMPGANFDLTPDDIAGKKQAIEECEIVVLQLEIPMKTVEYTLSLAKQIGKTTILNPAPAQKMSRDVLQYVDFLILNEHELVDLVGTVFHNEHKIQNISKVFLNQGVQAMIVTLGEQGCCYIDGQTFKRYGAYNVAVKDTTGAGDSFIGGFVASYIKKRDIDLAIEFAQKVAAITVTRFGAQSSFPTLDEVFQLDFSN